MSLEGEDQIQLQEASDSESPESATPPKKRKKYACVFRKLYTQSFSWATELKKGPTYAFCKKCHRDICLGQGETKDLRRHEQTALHGRCDSASCNSMSLQSYFGPRRSMSVIEAEVKSLGTC